MGALVETNQTLQTKTLDLEPDCALNVVIARLHEQLRQALVQLLPDLDAACERLQLQPVHRLRPHPPFIKRVYPSHINANLVDPKSSV